MCVFAAHTFSTTVAAVVVRHGLHCLSIATHVVYLQL